MRIRPKVLRYGMYIFLYGFLMYFIAAIFTLHRLKQQESPKDFGYSGFPKDGNQNQLFFTGILKMQTTSMGLVYKNSSSSKNIILREMESIKLNVPHKSNNVTPSKVIETDSYSSLRKWNNSHPLVFLHIGKNGGTSFDSIMKPIITRLHGNYVGYRHFDWSYIDTIQDPDVVLLLRDPVSRAVSHYHFSKTRYYLQIKNIKLGDYLLNPRLMLETRDIWQDGQAAVLWLTGTHIANWVGIRPHQVPEREIKSLDKRELCRKAAERLRQALWFGFLSDQERSFEMLQWQLGYTEKIKLSKHNSNPHPDITLREVQILESLMPIDLWLYKYAKTLFEARWTQYKTGLYNEPELPELPEINCKSTRFILACNKKSPIGPIYHVWNTSQENTQQQMELLPKKDWMY